MVKMLKKAMVVFSAVMLVGVPVAKTIAYAEEVKEDKIVEIDGELESLRKVDDMGMPYIDIQNFDVVFDHIRTKSDDQTISVDDIVENFEEGNLVFTGLRYLDMRIYNKEGKVSQTETYQKQLYLKDTSDIVSDQGNLKFEKNYADIEDVVQTVGTSFTLSVPVDVSCAYGYMWYQLTEVPMQLYKTFGEEKIEFNTNVFAGYEVSGEYGKTLNVNDLQRGDDGIYLCFELNENEMPCKLVSAFNVCVKSDLTVKPVKDEVMACVGDSVTLAVEVTSTTSKDLESYWIKKGSDDEKGEIVAFNTTELVIDDVSPEHFGTYVFVTYDSFVSKEVTIKLTRSMDDKNPVVANLTELKTQTRGTYAINISWNKANNATGYVVYKAVAGSWQRVGVTAKTNYTIGNLQAGTSYAFAVKPYANYYGTIIYASTHKSVSSFTKPLKSAKMVNVLSGYTAIKTSWTKSAGATGYAVYKVVGNQYVRVANVTTNSYTFGGLKRNTAYKFAVRPYKILGGQVAYSDAITTLTTRTKK